MSVAQRLSPTTCQRTSGFARPAGCALPRYWLLDAISEARDLDVVAAGIAGCDRLLGHRSRTCLSNAPPWSWSWPWSVERRIAGGQARTSGRGGRDRVDEASMCRVSPPRRAPRSSRSGGRQSRHRGAKTRSPPRVAPPPGRAVAMRAARRREKRPHVSSSGGSAAGGHDPGRRVTRALRHCGTAALQRCGAAGRARRARPRRTRRPTPEIRARSRQRALRARRAPSSNLAQARAQAQQRHQPRHSRATIGQHARAGPAGASPRTCCVTRPSTQSSVSMPGPSGASCAR